jgi:hypothetical protein
VCSARDEYFGTLRENVLQNVGVPFEIIRIDNKEGKFGICEAYNKGAADARFPYLCFIHEDVFVHTPGWGLLLQRHFESDPAIGLIGIAGSKIKTRMLSNWWQPVINGYEPKRGKVLQHFTNKPARITEWWEGDTVLDEVVTLDGVFLATRKAVWEQNRFDEKLLSRFHAYDFDFSMQVGRNWRLCAIRDILAEHFSEGTYDLEWIESTLKAHQKWKDLLPMSIYQKINSNDFAFLEQQYLNQVSRMLFSLKVGLLRSMRILFAAVSLLYPPASLKGVYWRAKMIAGWVKGHWNRA